MSKLYFYYGVMNASKSTELLLKTHQFEENNIPCLCIKPSIDNRDSVDEIVSRTGLRHKCISISIDTDIEKSMVNYFKQLEMEFKPKPRWILLDEAQFLTTEQVNQLGRIVDKLGVNIICYGLRTNFKTEMFEGSKRLFEIADNVEEINASCRCGEKAIFNARIGNEGLTTTGDEIVIGGNSIYKPLCRKCFNEMFEKKKEN